MAAQFELDWSSNQLSSSKYEQQESIDYFKIQEGNNILRIVGKPSKVEIHWEDTTDGGKRKIVCPGAGCPICAKGSRPKSRYECKVLDRRDGAVKMMDVGNSVISQIQAYAKDPDWGDPTKYDIKIERTGKGIDTRYNVMAGKNSDPLTDEQLKAVEEFPSVESVNPTMTIEQIKELPLVIFTESTDDLVQDSNTQYWNKL